MFQLEAEERPHGCAGPVAVFTIVGFFAFPAMFYYFPAVLFGGPIVFLSRKQVAWKLWEAYILVVPPLAYFVGLALSGNKGLIQPFLELLCLGFGVPVALAVRVLRDEDDASSVTPWLIGALALVAFVVGALIKRHMPPD
jgi:hypothetical protein